jgi:hypothetical protein
LSEYFRGWEGDVDFVDIGAGGYIGTRNDTVAIIYAWPNVNRHDWFLRLDLTSIDHEAEKIVSSNLYSPLKPPVVSFYIGQVIILSDFPDESKTCQISTECFLPTFRTLVILTL